MMTRSFRLLSWPTLFLLIVAGLIGLFVRKELVNWKRSAERQQQREALLADPFVAQVVAYNNTRCKTETDYYWASGVTLALPRWRPEEVICSSLDAPVFAGRLKDPRKPGDFKSWGGSAVLPGGGLCGGAACWMMFFGGRSQSQVFSARMPEVLPDKPDWPDFDKIDTYGTWQDGAWAQFQGMTVRFHFGQVPLGGVKSYLPPATVSSKHPRYPIGILITLPPGQHEMWQAALQEGFDLIDRSVMRVEDLGDDPVAPRNLQFRAGFFNRDLEVLKAWNDAGRKL